ADANALTNFVPAGRDLAIGISADGVMHIFEEIKDEQNIFRTYTTDDDDEFELKSLSLSLKSGALHFEGEVTVIDAIAWFDVDASFAVDVHLHWESGNHLKPSVDEPEVDTDLSILDWLVGILLGLFTGGALGVVVAVIVLVICQIVADNIGSNVAE